MNSLLRSCRVPSASTMIVRNRVSYYQPGNRWPPRFIRRFWIRYPNAHLYATLGVCTFGLIFPIVPWFYNYVTMQKEDFIRYRDQYNSVVRERQRSGTNLYIPFYNTNAATAPLASVGEEKKEE